MDISKAKKIIDFNREQKEKIDRQLEHFYARSGIPYGSTLKFDSWNYVKMTASNILEKNAVKNFLTAAYGSAEKISFKGITAQDVDAEEKRESVEETARLICEGREFRILI